jgi:N-acetylglucosaminyldiphosphoundecaprenol N-acetyl-beta-D-mannosaminyltransferase
VSNIRTESILGYEVLAEPPQKCVDGIVRSLKHAAQCRWLACMNPHSYAESLRNPSFHAALKEADWLVPDGAGMLLASRLLGGALRERVTGSDVFFGVNEALAHSGGGSVFFLGSTEETLACIRKRMAEDYPTVRVAGTLSPPFKPEYTPQELDSMIQAINEAAPDVLWVGMTAPKQELWIHFNRDRLRVKFAAAIGAVFDFYTGRVKRSHPFFQRFGLEWLPRLIQEPRRLWRRTFVSAPVFLMDAARAALRRRRS